MTPEQLYQMQQVYQKQDIIGKAKQARQLGNQKRAERQIDTSGLVSTPNNVVNMFNKISAQNDLQNKQNEMVNRQAYQNQLLERQIKGLGNAENIVGNSNVDVSGSGVVPVGNATPTVASISPGVKTIITPSGKIIPAVGDFSSGTMTKRYGTISDKSRSFYDNFNKHYIDKYGSGVAIATGGRTQDEQNKLYNQGRTTPGNVVTWTKNSKHIGGNAMDLVAGSGYKNADANMQLAREMRTYAKLNPQYGASFLKLSMDPNHIQFN